MASDDMASDDLISSDGLEPAAPTIGDAARLSDVARAAGVHVSTASRALNPALAQRLSPDVVERVRVAADALGYSRNALAASLRTRRSRTIGVVVPDLVNTMFPPMFRGIEDRLSEAGYSALLANSDFREDKEWRIFETFVDRRIDGLVLATAKLEHPVLTEARRRRIPLVLLNRSVADETVPAVVADDAAGMAAAVRHLVGLGHRRIGHIAGPQDTSTGRLRREAFIATMGDAGLPIDPRLVIVGEAFVESEGYRCGRRLLEMADRPSAIVAANDTLAIGCLSAIEEMGLACPEHVSLTGFNDMPFVNKLRPPLTTVRIPHYQMGFDAADELLRRITDPAAPVARRVLSPLLIVRQSTGAARAG